jgi:hypothetical protein
MYGEAACIEGIFHSNSSKITGDIKTIFLISELHNLYNSSGKLYEEIYTSTYIHRKYLYF